MKIKEVIVVEGKNDSQKLKSFFDCDTIETHGTHLSKQVLNTLKEVHKKRGIIVFTDPDYPGELTRRRINEVIDGAKNAFVMKEDARTSKKVGIEHASKEVLEEALKHIVTYQKESKETIAFDEYCALGFIGKENSAQLREKVGKVLFLGKCNAKTLYKRMNMLGLDKIQIEKVIEDVYE